MTLNVSHGLEDAGNIRWITQRCLPASIPYSIVGLTVLIHFPIFCQRQPGVVTDLIIHTRVVHGLG